MSVKWRVWGERWRSGVLFHRVCRWSISWNVFPFLSWSLRLLFRGDDPQLWLRCKSICQRHFFLCVLCEKVSDEIKFKKHSWSDQDLSRAGGRVTLPVLLILIVVYTPCFWSSRPTFSAIHMQKHAPRNSLICGSMYVNRCSFPVCPLTRKSLVRTIYLAAFQPGGSLMLCCN